MKDRLKETLGMIKAENSLKNSTREFIAKKIRGRGIKRRFYVCGAACACLLLIFLCGYWLYFTPAFEISIDINPSIELCVNRFERVISVSGFNEDGRELAEALDVNFRHYTEAVDLIFQDKKITALLSDNELIITVTDSNEERSEEVISRIEECTSHHENTHCCYISSNEAEEAHGLGLSGGRYMLLLELKALGCDITPEEINEMSVREIEELIESLECEENYGAGHGHHHHHGG